MAAFKEFDNWVLTLPEETRMRMNHHDALLAWLHRDTEVARLRKENEELRKELEGLSALVRR